jgi:hypothetical protein
MSFITEPPASSSAPPSQSNDVKITTLPQLNNNNLESSAISTTISASTMSPISEKQNFTTDLDLCYSSDIEPLPPKRHNRFLRNARHTFFTVYRRLFTVVFTLSIVGVVGLFFKHRREMKNAVLLADLANIASANVMVALLVRVDYIVNAFFK